MAMKGFETIVLILVAVLVLHTVGVVNFAAIAGVEDGEAGVTVVKVDVGEKACGSTTMTVGFEVAHKSGTDVTAQNATVFINGARKGVFSEGGTFTAMGGDNLRVYNALDPAQTDYLASYSTGSIPCTGQTAAFLTSLTSYLGEPFMVLGEGQSSLQSVGKVYESNSAAAAETVINDDFTANPGTALSLTAGETKVVTIRLKPVFEEGYGVADGSTIACRLSDSQIDQAKVTIQSGGALLGSAKYIPSSGLYSVSATNQTLKYWHLPAIDGAVTSAVELLMAIKSDDTNEATAATNVSCATFGTDFYEADDGSVKIDVEDRDDNSKIGRSTANEFEWFIDVS